MIGLLGTFVTIVSDENRNGGRKASIELLTRIGADARKASAAGFGELRADYLIEHTASTSQLWSYSRADRNASYAQFAQELG